MKRSLVDMQGAALVVRVPALCAAVLGFVLACSQPLDARSEVPEGLQVPWSEREWNAPMLHGHTDGLALTGDGRVLAAAFSGSPMNEIALVDIRARTATTLRGHDARVMLAQPAFSPDGRRLAVVATPLGRFGVSEIWIVDLRTGVAEVIAQPERSFQFPAFSSNGSHLSYFKDVSGTRWRPGYMRPEYRNFVPYALFQRDLQSGEETQLSEQPFLSPCGLFYDTLERGLFYCAIDPLVSDNSQGDRVWTLPSWALEYRNETRGASNFLLRWGEQIPPRPTLYAPDNRLTRHARLSGVLSEGRVLLNGIGEAPTPRSFGLVTDGSDVTEVFAPDTTGSFDRNLTTSSDGSTIIGLQHAPDADAEVLVPTLIVRIQEREERIALNEIHFAPTAMNIVPNDERARKR